MQYHNPGYNIQLIFDIFKFGIIKTMSKEIKSYQHHIASRLYPGMISNQDRILQDLHYISESTGKRMHMILDQSYGIVHINTENKLDQIEIVERLFKIGQILKKVEIKKDRSIFLYRNYITFKLVGQCFPIVLS